MRIVYAHIKPLLDAGYLVPALEVVARVNDDDPMHQDRFTGQAVFKRVGGGGGGKGGPCAHPACTAAAPTCCTLHSNQLQPARH
jgi:hypothetical protein